MAALENETQECFSQHFVQVGNALTAYQLTLVQLGKTNQMQPHSMRARASGLLNHYLVDRRIKELIQQRKDNGEALPKFRKRQEMNLAGYDKREQRKRQKRS